MRRLLFLPAAAVVVLMVLAGCAGMSRGHGPVESFMMPAASNPGFPQDLPGALAIGQEPKQVMFVVAPGTDLHSLVLKLTLNTEATITVISSGTRVVQQNGLTPNDFSSPVMYAVEVPGDKEPWKYVVSVRQVETNPNLAMIRAPAGSVLSPPFNPAVYQYQLQVPYASTDVRIEVRAQSRFARSVTVDGRETPGPVGAAVVDFSQVPQKPVAIEILAEDGVTRGTYQFTIVRGAPDTNAFLSSLDIQGVPSSPGFSPTQMGYQAMVPYETQTIVIRARPQSPSATVALTAALQIKGGVAGTAPFNATGDAAGPGGAQVDFSQAAELPLIVQVTAQDGVTVQQYLVDIRRGPPDGNNLLSDLTVVSEGTAVNLFPVFAPTVLSYSAAVPFPARQIRVIAHAQSRVAVLQAGGGFSAARTRMGLQSRGDPASPDGMVIDLPPEADRFSITVLVMAQNGAALQYFLDLRRAPPPPMIVQAQPAPAPQPAPAQPTHPPQVVQQPRPAPVQPPALQPAPQPAPAQPPALQRPPANPPIVAGADHFTVSMDLSLGSRETAALSATSDLPGNTATITIRPYRTGQIIVQDTVPLQAGKRGNALALSLRYKTPGVKLGQEGLIEAEIAIPTRAGKFLVYKEAFPADHEMNLNVPFLLYSSVPSIPWPAVGSPVQVAGYVSTAADHPEAHEKLRGNEKNETEITIRLADAKTGAAYGSNTFWRKPGLARGQSVGFTSGLAVPEGATVTYTLTAAAANGRAWSAGGQGLVWTTRLRYEGGFESVLLPVSDSLAQMPEGKDKPGRDKDR